MSKKLLIATFYASLSVVISLIGIWLVKLLACLLGDTTITFVFVFISLVYIFYKFD